jgi:hypothetical protein
VADKRILEAIHVGNDDGHIHRNPRLPATASDAGPWPKLSDSGGDPEDNDIINSCGAVWMVRGIARILLSGSVLTTRGPTTGRIRRIERIVPNVGVEVEAIFVTDRISLQEPPYSRRVGTRFVMPKWRSPRQARSPREPEPRPRIRPSRRLTIGVMVHPVIRQLVSKFVA